MKKADELWKNYARNGLTEIGKVDFLAALAEYGEAVRGEVVKVLEDNWFKTQSDCAAAIEKMKLP
jgi:hypothetical protein